MTNLNRRTFIFGSVVVTFGSSTFVEAVEPWFKPAGFSRGKDLFANSNSQLQKINERILILNIIQFQNKICDLPVEDYVAVMTDLMTSYYHKGVLEDFVVDGEHIAVQPLGSEVFWFLPKPDMMYYG